VIGIDYAKDSILSAGDNVRHLKPFPLSRFYAAKVDPHSLESFLPTSKMDESVILDPPRKGSAPGVIEYLAHRGVGRVLHIFCGVDEMPRELSIWRKCGYRTLRIIPVDMFPGTFSLEVMALLEKEEIHSGRQSSIKIKHEGLHPRR